MGGSTVHKQLRAIELRRPVLAVDVVPRERHADVLHRRRASHHLPALAQTSGVGCGRSLRLLHRHHRYHFGAR